MIKFPNLNNYVSIYSNNANIITIRIYEYPNKNRAKYFNVHIPVIYHNMFIEMLQNILKNKFTNLRIEQAKTDVTFETITIWQLAWFIDNIVEYKRVLISIEEPNNENHWIHTGVYLNDEKDFNRLKEQINRFYDDDFDGIVDNQ